MVEVEIAATTPPPGALAATAVPIPVVSRLQQYLMAWSASNDVDSDY